MANKILFGICALIVAIFILFKILALLISALWYIAVVGFVGLGLYFIINSLKQKQ